MTARTEAMRPDDAARATRSWRRRLLLADGLFLLVAGVAQVVFEWLSFSSGSGPLGATFEGSPFTLGWVEAHGLACLLGLLLLSVAARGARREWHVVALGVHLLLGGANVLFWGSFVAFDTVPLGIAATVAHACFVIAHGWAHVRSAPASTRRAVGRGAAREPSLVTPSRRRPSACGWPCWPGRTGCRRGCR